MHKKLNQIGSSWGVILPKTLIELLKINPENDEIEITVIGDELRIKKYTEE